MTSLPTNDGGAVLKRKLLQDPYLSCPGDPKDALKLYLPKWFLGFLNDMWTLVCDDLIMVKLYLLLKANLLLGSMRLFGRILSSLHSRHNQVL